MITNLPIPYDLCIGISISCLLWWVKVLTMGEGLLFWNFNPHEDSFPALVHGGDRTQLLHWQLNYDHPRHKLKHIVNNVNYKEHAWSIIHTQYIVSAGEMCNNESVLVRNVEANTGYSETWSQSDADKSPSHLSTIDTESVLKCTLELCTFLGVRLL